MAVQFLDIPLPVDLVEADINKFFDHLVACLDRRRLELLASVRDIRLDIAGRPAARAREEEELIGLRADTEFRLLMNPLRETQLEILATLDRKLSDVRRPLPEIRLLFRGGCEELEQLIRGVGEIGEEEVPAVPRYQDLRPVVAVAKNGRAPGELYGPRCVVVDEKANQIYVAEGSLNLARVSIFSETGDFINTFPSEHLSSPWGIAVHNDNVYVTDIEEHSIFHFKVSGDVRLVASQGGRGTGFGRFREPKQLAVSPTREIFVSDCRNNRVQILNSKLQYQRHISHPSMTRPCDVKLTPDEVFILSSSDSPCIHAFSHTGDKLRALVTRGYGVDVTDARFLCLDASGNMIISDRSTHQIKVFSAKGVLMHSLGEPGHEVGMFHLPQGVALLHSLKLVILSCSNNYRLQIFSS